MSLYRGLFYLLGRFPLFPSNIFSCVWASPNNRIAVRSGWVPWPCTPRVLFHEILMTCSIVLQISSAGFEYRRVEHLFQTWRFMKVSWPYFFLLDVSLALSAYCSHIQVRRWRCMDENDARAGFIRRKTLEKILQLAAFDKMKCPPRAETSFILALYRTISSSAVLLKSQRLRGIFWRDFCPFSRRFELCSRVNNLRHPHISKTLHVSRDCPELGNVQGEPVFDTACQLHDRTLLGCQRQSWKVEKVSSAEYRRTLTSCPATTHIGFRVSEGQRKGS